ncbi:MAG: hypothetical protein VSS52_003175 [Thiotrichaceae bacterium]|nr:hypothetical protein [Thiotrichaceae bacterium]
MTTSIASLFVNTDRYSLTAEAGQALQAEFAKQRCVKLQNFYQGTALELLQQEVERLAEKAIRRNFQMTETHETPRRLSTLNGEVIDQYSTLVPRLYQDPKVLTFLSAIVGEQLHNVTDPGENYVLNILEQQQDTHGAHIDTYAYTLITVIKTPEQGAGGCLELVPNSDDPLAFDKYPEKIISLCASPGDCILLAANSSVHRVTPLIKPARRVVIASALSNGHTLGQVSYSSEKLYGNTIPT